MPRYPMIQTLAGDDDRARVLSIYAISWGLTPLGGPVAGLLASHVVVQTALADRSALVLR